MKLVDDAATLWKRWSSRIAALQVVTVPFWLGLPDDWKAAVPGWVLALTVAVFGAAFLTAQAVKQPSLNPDA